LLPHDIVTALATDKNNTIWIGTAFWQGKGGLLKINNGVWEIYHKGNSQIRYNEVNNISISSTNKILISSPAMFFGRQNIAEGYLQEFDGTANWKDISPFNPQITLTNRVTASTYDRNSNVWVATSVDGNICSACEYALSKFNGQNWFVLSPKNGNFPRTFISDIKADKDNNVWVAAGDVGLIKVTQ
jgi:ligand-binding sensor domain-containing protein